MTIQDSKRSPVVARYTPVCVDGSVGDQQVSPVHLSTMSSRCWAWQNSPPSLANAIQVQPEEKQSGQVRRRDAARGRLASESRRFHSLWCQLSRWFIERTWENVTAPGCRHTIDDAAAA